MKIKELGWIVWMDCCEWKIDGCRLHRIVRNKSDSVPNLHLEKLLSYW